MKTMQHFFFTFIIACAWHANVFSAAGPAGLLFASRPDRCAGPLERRQAFRHPRDRGRQYGRKFGIVAGYVGGWLNSVLMRIIDESTGSAPVYSAQDPSTA